MQSQFLVKERIKALYSLLLLFLNATRWLNMDVENQTHTRNGYTIQYTSLLAPCPVLPLSQTQLLFQHTGLTSYQKVKYQIISTNTQVLDYINGPQNIDITIHALLQTTFNIIMLYIPLTQHVCNILVVIHCADFLGVFVKLVACIKKNDEPYLLLILRNEL